MCICIADFKKSLEDYYKQGILNEISQTNICIAGADNSGRIIYIVLLFPRLVIPKWTKTKADKKVLSACFYINPKLKSWILLLFRRIDT